MKLLDSKTDHFKVMDKLLSDNDVDVHDLGFICDDEVIAHLYRLVVCGALLLSLFWEAYVCAHLGDDVRHIQRLEEVLLSPRLEALVLLDNVRCCRRGHDEEWQALQVCVSLDFLADRITARRL